MDLIWDNPPYTTPETKEKLLRTLGKIGDSLGGEMKKLGGEMGKLGDSLGEKVEELFAGDPPPSGAPPGGKAGAGAVRR